MMRLWRILLGTSACLVLVCGTHAIGQIDHRVNQGNASAAGRLLESNPQIGSRGLNITSPGMSTPGSRADAIVSGNVTGLAGFKGQSPVIQNNQFRASLPSSGLSGFQARGVGLRDVLSGRTHETGFFFGAPETISDLGYIRAGLNQPGSSMLRSTSVSPPSSSAVVDPSSSALIQSLRSPEDLRVGISRPELRPGATSDFGMRMAEIGPGLSGDRGASTTSAPYRSAMSSSIFGTPPPDRLTAPRPTGPLPRGPLPTPMSPTISPYESTDVPASPVRTVTEDPALRRVDTEVARAPDGPLATPIGYESAALQLPSLESEGLPGLPDLPALPIEPGPPPVTLGADRFADLYSAVGVAQSLGVDHLGFDLETSAPSPGAGPDAIGRELAPTDEIMRGVLRRPSERLHDVTAGARWASDVLEHPITTFVGHHESRLNEYMGAGEAELHAGRYYNAARLFELASTIDPSNPLPLLARGHALAAAGDYRSAVRFLVMGIERFPQIAAFRLDLPALVGKPDVFDIRRADLEDKLEKTESPEFRFLLGYLELYSGLPEEGVKNLRLASDTSDPDSVIGMFVDLVTGQRELPPL